MNNISLTSSETTLIIHSLLMYKNYLSGLKRNDIVESQMRANEKLLNYISRIDRLNTEKQQQN